VTVKMGQKTREENEVPLPLRQTNHRPQENASGGTKDARGSEGDRLSTSRPNRKRGKNATNRRRHGENQSPKEIDFLKRHTGAFHCLMGQRDNRGVLGTQIGLLANLFRVNG